MSTRKMMRLIGWYWIVAVTLIFTSVARAQNVNVTVDTSLADYILELACSGEQVDEEHLSNSRLLQAQIKHHSGNSDRFSMAGFIDAAKIRGCDHFTGCYRSF